METQPSVATRLAAAAGISAAVAEVHGHVAAAAGLAVELVGFGPLLAVGDRISLLRRDTQTVPAEVVGFNGNRARAIPLDSLIGIGPGMRASHAGSSQASLAVHESWLGRVIDPLGRPIDGAGPLARGRLRPVRADPPLAANRNRLGSRRQLGVRALDLFTPCRTGQRLGLFAGSGVGKSTLLAMLAARAECDVVVIALVGERGREVREFIEDELGAALSRAVVVVATSDQSPVLRREAAYAATTVAEHFRDAGHSVLLLMDSVTRFCHALREIGLAAGEPPAARGYPPSVTAELPRLLERAGPGPSGTGAITGLFTVLVDGDDLDEPVSDAVRGILDGHVILSRRIAEGGRYPAVDVLRSLSRTAPGCLDPEDATLVRDARTVLAQAADLEDLVRLGAYRSGSDAAADRALRLAPRIEAVLHQENGAAPTGDEDPFRMLRTALQDDDAQ